MEFGADFMYKRRSAALLRIRWEILFVMYAHACNQGGVTSPDIILVVISQGCGSLLLKIL